MLRYLIVGAGRSALGACKLLLRDGNAVTISDIEEKFPAALMEIRASGARVIIGPQGESLLTGIDRIVVSPGLSPKIPLLTKARALNIPIVSEIDIALERYAGLVLGVTGTNGKSTTTLLLAHFLKASGLDAEASGNIGIAPSLLLAEGKRPEALVLELSSYQLDYSARLPSRVALFMSFAPDHMERHGTLKAYFQAKWKLIEACEGLIIMPRKIIECALAYQVPVPKVPIAQILIDDEAFIPYGQSVPVTIGSRSQSLSSELLPSPAALFFPLPLERHNQLNVAAALVAAHFIRPYPHYLQSLDSFAWLPYRFQNIGSIGGQSVYNDSKSTNVESTEIALQSLAAPCILLLGGAPKGESYAPLLAQRAKISMLISFGAAGAQINQDLAALQPLSFPSLKAALSALPGLMQKHPGPLVFSPANASFDEFQNFEERGAFFNAAVTPLLDPKNF